jgi:hypothetical protein
VQQAVPLPQPPLAEDVGREDAGESSPTASTSTPRPGTLAQPLDVLACATAAAPPACRQQPREDAVERAEQPGQHPDRDGQRQPDQQAGDEVLFHRRIRRALRRRPAAPAGAAAAGAAGFTAAFSAPLPAGPASLALDLSVALDSAALSSGGFVAGRLVVAGLVVLLGRLVAAVAEVGHVPARTLELEAGRRELLGKGGRTARRAVVSNGSEIFCSTSCAWPQAVQR